VFTRVEFNPAAFRHDISESDILRAINMFLYEDPLEEFENKYLVIGFDTKGRLLEIMYNIIDEESINVFHAMPCRREFYSLLQEIR
jgi:hypothetical protein